MRFDFSQCPGYCEQIRRQMIRANHPLHSRDEPGPAWRSPDQALAMLLEEKDDLVQGIEVMNGRLVEVQAGIRSLRDCA